MRRGIGFAHDHPEARRQIILFDRILKTKRDVKAVSSKLDAILKAINPFATVIDSISDTEPSLTLLDTTSLIALGPDSRATDHVHKNDITAIALSTSKALSPLALELFLDRLQDVCGNGLLRVKGLVRTADDPDNSLLVQGVDRSFDTPRHLPQWLDCDTTTRLVMIGLELDKRAIRREFDALTATPVVDSPNRQALEENPLSVPRFF